MYCLQALNKVNNNMELFMCVFLALNRVKNNKAIFEAVSPIKIKSTSHPGIVQLRTLTGYSSGLT